MAKEKVVKKEEAKKDIKPDGSRDKPFPWVEPFPASDLDKDGNETVFVRATVTQELTVNANRLNVGQHTVGADFAHQHNAVLAAPK